MTDSDGHRRCMASNQISNHIFHHSRLGGCLQHCKQDLLTIFIQANICTPNRIVASRDAWEYHTRSDIKLLPPSIELNLIKVLFAIHFIKQWFLCEFPILCATVHMFFRSPRSFDSGHCQQNASFVNQFLLWSSYWLVFHYGLLCSIIPLTSTQHKYNRQTIRMRFQSDTPFKIHSLHMLIFNLLTRFSFGGLTIY